MSPVRVSDHAVLRYLERVGGFEVEKLRAEMASRVEAVRAPNATYVRLDGVSFVVRDESGGAVVTTVISKGKPYRPRKRRKGAK